MANLCQNILKMMNGSNDVEMLKHIMSSNGDILKPRFEHMTKNDDIYFKFDTKWEPPMNLINCIANTFPHVGILLEYREPGMGFEGHVGWFNGQQILNIRKDFNGEKIKAWKAWNRPIQKIVKT